MPRSKRPSLQVLLQAVDRISAPIKRVSNNIRKLGTPIAHVTTRLRALGRSLHLDNLRSRLSAVGTNLGRLFRRVALFGGALATASGLALKKFIDIGDSIAKTAGTIGIGIEALQEWRFAADRSGVSQQKLDKALQVFSRSLGEARAGTGTLITILKKSNPALLQQLRSVESTEEGLDLLLSAMEKMGSQLDRNALANAAFGRSGVLLANLLKLPKTEIDALRQTARDLGLVMDEETARAAEETQDRLTDLKAVIKGVGFSIGAGLLPMVRDIIQNLIGWSKANRTLLHEDIPRYVRRVVVQVSDFAAWIGRVLPPTLDFIDAIGGLKTVVIALGTALTLSLLAPLGPVVGGLVLAAGVILAVWEPVKAFFEDFEKKWREWDITGGLGRQVAAFFGATPEGLAQAGGGAGGAEASLARPSSAPFLRAPQRGVNGLIRVEVEDSRVKATVQEASGTHIEADSGFLPAPS